MRKRFLILIFSLSLLLLFFGAKVNAEDGEPIEAEQPAEVEQSAEVEAEESGVEESGVEESGWEYFIKNYLSAEKVALYLSWIAYIGTIIGLVANIKRLKSSNNLTLKNVSDDVKETIESVVGDNIKEEVDKFVPALIKVQEKTNDILKVFSKILALGQENTPESRVAILNLIEELGTAGKEIVDNAKVVIEEEVKSIQEHKEDIENKLDKIIEEYDGTSI